MLGASRAVGRSQRGKGGAEDNVVAATQWQCCEAVVVRIREAPGRNSGVMWLVGELAARCARQKLARRRHWDALAPDVQAGERGSALL